MPRRLKHARRRGEKYTVSVRVHPGPGGLKTCTMDLTATQETIDAWCADQRKKYGGVRDTPGGLRAAVIAYLAGRTDLPADTLAAFTRILGDWIRELGADRTPLSVETPEIDDVIRRWTPHYAPDYLYKRVGVLFTFYGTMYPKQANPVKDAQRPKRIEPEARELSYPDIDAAIQSMPTYTHRKGGRVLNQAKLRLRCQAETGLPPGIIGKIRPTDLNFLTATLHVAGRDKGAGIEPRTLELSPEAVDAFKAFHAANAYGPYTPGSIAATNKAFRRACARVGVPLRGVTQYILRHSFLTQLYRAHPDEATVQRLGLHAPGSHVTRRYTKAAHPDINRAAVAALHAARTQARRGAIKAVPVQEKSQKLSQKVVKGRKSFRHAS